MAPRQPEEKFFSGLVALLCFLPKGIENCLPARSLLTYWLPFYDFCAAVVAALCRKPTHTHTHTLFTHPPLPSRKSWEKILATRQIDEKGGV